MALKTLSPGITTDSPFRWHSQTSFSAPPLPATMMMTRHESATARDRRLFGGEDDDTASALDLRGPMLDVVLGLFDGIDYDDDVAAMV